MFKNYPFVVSIGTAARTPWEIRKKVFFFQMCCFYFLGRIRFYIRLEDTFKHCIALAHYPRTQYQRRQNEYAYQSASCGCWNFLIHQFCIKRMCKYLFFFNLWLANAFSNYIVKWNITEKINHIIAWKIHTIFFKWSKLLYSIFQLFIR